MNMKVIIERQTGWINDLKDFNIYHNDSFILKLYNKEKKRTQITKFSLSIAYQNQFPQIISFGSKRRR